MTDEQNFSRKKYRASARAHANVAAAKYWGKRNDSLNLPIFDSIAFNIDALSTETTATWTDDERDALIINDWHVPPQSMTRISRLLDKIREMKGWKKHCTLVSRNNFPLSTGLASSASGGAAATMAAVHAAQLDLPQSQISALARLCSGSAARSIPQGWTRWRAGSAEDGSDSFAVSIAPPNHWNLQLFVIQVSDAPKNISSTEGMKRSESSPFWNAYIAEAARAADVIQNAILQKDFRAFSEAVMQNTMMMHAVALTAKPPVCYFAPKTIEILQKIMRICRAMPVCCTIDAGANVVVITDNIAAPFVKNDIIAMGLTYIQSCVGGGTELITA